MKRAYKVLPVYAGDVSGCCSALYELGGMVIIHDPSGCNSTYNTHDEVRWDKLESLIFISGLTDVDAITGDDKKLIDEIVDAAMIHKPKFIAIANSPIPYVNGTDFDYISKEVNRQTGIKTFAVKTNAFHDYVKGASKAFFAVAENLVGGDEQKDDRDNIKTCNKINEKNCEVEKIKINIIGTTPLDFTENEVKYIRDFFTDKGFEIISNWSYGSSLEDIAKSANADVNVVVSSTGLLAAKSLYEKYNIPYVVGLPIGIMGDIMVSYIREAINDNKPRISYLDGMESNKKINNNKGKSFDDIIVGEAVFAGSLSAALGCNDGKKISVCVSTESDVELVREGDFCIQSEEEIETLLSKAKKIWGDPVFKHIAPREAEFVGISHFGLSGRLYTNTHKSIFDMGD